MSLALSSLCASCRARTSRSLPPASLSSPLRSPSARHQILSLQVRHAGVKAWQKPSKHHDLSKDVSRSRVRRQGDKDGGAAKPRRAPKFGGPFGTMNRAEAPKALSPIERLRSVPERGPKGKAVPEPPKPMVDRERISPNRRAKNFDRKTTGGFKALKMQQALSTIGYDARNSVKKRIANVDSFEQFDVLPEVHDAITEHALKGLAEVKPTPIQKLAVPILLNNGPAETRGSRRRGLSTKAGMTQFLLAAETGSGKTLAYLVPAFNAIKIAEAEEARLAKLEDKSDKPNESSLNLFDMEELERQDAMQTEGRPRVVVLVPTAELVDQVGKTAKQLSHGAKCRVSFISSAYSSKVIRNRLFRQDIDLVVSTPHLFSAIVTSTPSVLSRVTHLVVDEADSLFDRSFSDLTEEIILRAKPTLQQLIMCSATIPRRMDNYLRDKYPDVVRLTTPNLHAIPRRVQLSVVDCMKGNFFGNKDLACAESIWNIGSSHVGSVTVGESKDEAEDDIDIDASSPPADAIKRIIVFVNEREKSVQVAKYLQEKGIDAMALNRDVGARQENSLIAEFTGESTSEETQRNGGMSEAWSRSKVLRKLPNTRVLVTTDIASRGIDTTPVRDVILYDVPHTSIDFIHRLGRTGRMGRRGRGLVLVGKNDRRDVVSEVKHGMYLGQALI